jgi:hypothetical protein
MTTIAPSATGPARVTEVRSFIRGRRRRRWFDWYFIVFVVVLGAFMLSDFLAEPLSRLVSTGSTAPGQAEAGAALVLAAAAGLVLLAQLLGPLALSPADASWLLLTPLNRRDVLRRPVTTAAAVCLLTGALLGVLALTMAAPYVRHGTRHALGAWLVPAAIAGAASFLAAAFTAMLAQPWPPWRARLRMICAAVAVAASLCAVVGERWAALPHHVTSVLASLSVTAADVIAAIALALSCGIALLVRLALPRFPAGVLSADSARAGTTRLAAAYLNVPLLTWLAEDSYWRGRLLKPRPWPKAVTPSAKAISPPASARVSSLAAACALAWVDWRRLARRPNLLIALAASSLAPAVVGAALTGDARGYGVAAVLLGGAIAAGVQGTAAIRRDANDPTLFRLLGVDPAAALAARCVLPALLSTVWLVLALIVAVLTGPLSGWLWLLAGLAAGPGVAAAALRIARTGPVDPTEQGPETPLGPMPPWLITRALSVLLGITAGYPLLTAVRTGHVHASTVAAQLAVSPIVLGGYLLVTRTAGKAASAD